MALTHLRKAMANEELKAAVKEAAKEWMDDQFAKIGKWTFGTLAALIFTALVVMAVKYGSPN